MPSRRLRRRSRPPLSFHAIEFPFTHDLEGLAELFEEAGVELPAPLERVGDLTPYGVRFRYGAIGDDESIDVDDALGLAHAAVAWSAAMVAPARDEP